MQIMIIIFMIIIFMIIEFMVIKGDLVVFWAEVWLEIWLERDCLLLLQ